MIAKPNLVEPPLTVLRDMAISAVCDFKNIPPDILKEPIELGGEGIDFVSSRFHNRFEKLIYGFDKGMLWWYLTGAKSIDEIASAVQSYIAELLKT